MNVKNLHQGIYVDIMMLHKVPADNERIHKKVYYASKFVTLYALTQRNWKPKTSGQAMVVGLLKVLPCQMIAKWCYKQIYKYDDMKDGFKWCYWITPAKFLQDSLKRVSSMNLWMCLLKIQFFMAQNISRNISSIAMGTT